MKGFFIFFCSVVFVISIEAVDMGVATGISHFRYAEVGKNTKDDLYIMNSALIGLSVKNRMKIFDLKGSISAQLPYSFTLTDAFGTDEANYLEILFFWGINSNVSLGYRFLNNDKIKSGVGIFLNWDFFYFHDLPLDSGDEYIFSVLGSGFELSSTFSVKKFLDIEINAGYTFNFLPLHNRGTSFKWSDNILVSIGLLYRIL